MLVKVIVILFLLVIAGSLASALLFLYKDGGRSDRAVKALTVRIVLSLALFLMLMAGYYFGVIPLAGISR